MRWLLFLSLFLAVCLPAAAQQPNTPAATARWNSHDGPPWPIQADITLTSVLNLQVTGAPLSGYILAWTPGSIAPGTAMTPGGIVDLDFTASVAIVMDGIFFTTGSFFDVLANTQTSGVSNWSFPLGESTLGLNGGIQAAVVDAASPLGFTFSAATDLTITDDRIYVDGSGSPFNPGTRTHPLSSINSAINLASTTTPKGRVWVGQGAYNETLAFANGVSVEGGFDASTWTRSGSTYSIVISPASFHQANLITSTTLIRGLDLRALPAVAAGESSIALFIGASSSLFKIDDCRFVAGDGQDGLSGAAGTPGTAGANGSSGQNGTSGSNSGGAGGSGGSSLFGSNGGNGGFGGFDDSNGANGQRGFLSSLSSGGFGGAGGLASDCNDPSPVGGANGAAGAMGPNGTHSMAGGTVPQITTFGMVNPANGGAGSAGGAGAGGGGGGGGGGGPAGFPVCVADRAGGGGGGGSGGFGGGFGTGGGGGGSSVGVAIFNSSVMITNCHVTTGNGGDGGDGGNGALGGNGGSGGPGGAGADDATAGGAGGPGGSGGRGGAGAGGAGGRSVGIWRSSSPGTTVTGLTGTLGLGGQGGNGGVAPGIPGPAAFGQNGAATLLL